MRKITLMFVTALAVIAQTFAQTPQAFKYQSVARDNSGNIIANKKVSFKISILQGSASGTAVYSETDTATTNAFGLVNLSIGNGTVVSGSFSTIKWGADTYFTKIEFDPAGGTSYSLMGTSQMLSVPYALYAERAGNGSSTQTYLVLAGDITDAEAVQRIHDEAGANTQFIWVLNTTKLTTVSFPGVNKLVEIQISNNDALLTVTFPTLTDVWSGISVDRNKELTSISFPSLINCIGNFSISDNLKVNNINFPVLTKCSKEFNIVNDVALTSLSFPALSSVAYAFRIGGNTLLTSLNFPALTHSSLIVGDKYYKNPALTSISLPVLSSGGVTFSYTNLTSLSLPAFTTGYISIGRDDNEPSKLNNLELPLFTSGTVMIYHTALTSLNLPKLTKTSDFSIGYNSTLTAINIPILSNFGSLLNFSYNALTPANVNSILGTLVAISPVITGKNISLDNQTPVAPPTGQGITDKATLITNGNTVTTD